MCLVKWPRADFCFIFIFVLFLFLYLYFVLFDIIDSLISCESLYLLTGEFNSCTFITMTEAFGPAPTVLSCISYLSCFLFVSLVFFSCILVDWAIFSQIKLGCEV